MIELTRLNGHAIAVNCDLIRYAEAQPDTVLTLVTGEKLLVRETVAEVMKMAFGYRVTVLRTAWPESGHALSAFTALAQTPMEA